MQEDMHYYATYAMARAAGIEVTKARVIAYAAQYVDDSTDNDSEVHEDGGMFTTVATAHTNAEAVGNAVADHAEQRKVWIPFHFYPGNSGTSLSQKLLCRKDGPLVREMTQNHIRHALRLKGSYGLHLLGIMAHVYADTFSHYGFSGVSSTQNKVDGQSFELDVKDPKMKAYVMNKYSSFISKYAPSFLLKNYRNIISKGASVATGALGHGAVGTYPDRPYLKWRFRYKLQSEQTQWRDNPATFLEGCEKLHLLFSQFMKEQGGAKNAVAFAEIKESVDKLLRQELPKQGRIDAWVDLINSGQLFATEDNEALHFSKHDWEQQKSDFEDVNHSSEMAQMDVYKFHQAATYHRDYTLKQLLP